MVADGLAMLEEGLAELGAMDPAARCDTETIERLYRARNQLESLVTTSVGAFDASSEWCFIGARSAAAWIAHITREPFAAAKATVRLAAALRDMEVVAKAWASGQITRRHVGLLSRARSPEVAEAFARDEKALVDDAVHLSYRGFSRAVEYWVINNDPDRADRSYKEKEERRRLHISESIDGIWFGDFALAPIEGRAVRDELARLEEEFYRADVAEATERLGRDPLHWELRRTSAQRRADALVEMAIRSRTAPAGGRRPAPLFSVFVNYETICEIAGRVIPPSALIPWLDQAWIERVVFDSPSRVIDVGVERRLFKGATKRAVQVRDRECYHPTCEVPAEECEIDHIVPASADGPTEQTNGRVACGFHNRLRNGPAP